MVKYQLEYLTSAVSLFSGDGIVVHLLNEAQKNATTRVIIYQNTGAGAIVATDSGDIVVAPTWVWGLSYTLSSNGEYWVRIKASSDTLIPKASFERDIASVWTPVISYLPNTFAIFDLRGVKKRIW